MGGWGPDSDQPKDTGALDENIKVMLSAVAQTLTR